MLRQLHYRTYYYCASSYNTVSDPFVVRGKYIATAPPGHYIITCRLKQEAQLMLTTGSTRLAVSRGQQTWYHSTCYI